MKIPDRWLNYSESGRIIGTRFVAFKTPLGERYSTTLAVNKSFTPRRLLRKHPDIKLVIDLTFCTRYYSGKKEFEENGIQYIKMKCRGQKIPQELLFQKFLKIVDDFIATTPEDCLIGVHCTHGVNRTGYFIVRYMIERLRYTPPNALRVVVHCRINFTPKQKKCADGTPLMDRLLKNPNPLPVTFLRDEDDPEL